MQQTTIGWIGLGKMGVPMSQQLIKAGYTVTPYNRHKDKAAALIAAVDIIFLMVTDDAAIKDVFSGSNGLLAADTTGKIIINMSTVSPAISKEMAAAAGAKGHHYLDAPVSGSVKQAEEGQLVIMVGGEEEIFGKVKPIFEKLGKLAMHVGPAGAGNTAKLVINTLLAIHAQGIAEAAIFAQQGGVRLEDLFTLLGNGAMANVFMKIKGDAIMKDNYQPAFALKHIVKDLNLAKDIGMNTPLGKTALQSYEAAAPKHGDEDLIAIIKTLTAN